MEYKQDVHSDLYDLIIIDIGDSYAKVFSIVKRMTGNSTIETKKIFDLKKIVVGRNSKRELIQLSIELKKAGAKTTMERTSLPLYPSSSEHSN